MDIPIIIEPVESVGYRASGLGLSAEGASSGDAVRRLREQIEERVARGARIIPLEIPAAENPWLKFAGGLKDHPLLDRWEQAMKEYRKEIDSHPIEP